MVAAPGGALLFVQLGGIRPYDRPTVLVVGTCLGWRVIASVAAWIGVARGGSMLGRSTASLVTLIVATPLALLAWKVGVTVPFGPQMLAPWPTRPGFRCLWLSVAMAVPLLVAFVAVRRRSDPVRPGVAGAALGVTVGVAAGALVDLWCPVGFVPHVLLGHILPLLVVAALVHGRGGDSSGRSGVRYALEPSARRVYQPAALP